MSALPLMLRSADKPTPSAMAPDLADSLVVLLESAGRDLDGDREAARATIARAASLLRVAIDRSANPAPTPSTRGALAGWQVNRLKGFIDDHLDQTIHIKDLAAVAQRSTAYFCRAFKRTFGETPHAFIVRRRLARAAHLMLASDLALCEIALCCGFTDQAHLCKLFRQKYGQSPAVWRRDRRASVGEDLSSSLVISGALAPSNRAWLAAS